MTTSFLHDVGLQDPPKNTAPQDTADVAHSHTIIRGI